MADASTIPGGLRAVQDRRSLPPGANHFCTVLRRGDRLAGEVEFRGHRLVLEVPPDGSVLFPTDTGLALLKALEQPADTLFQGKRVLDVGCGSGIYTVALLLAGADHVAALDVNSACLSTTAENVIRNGIDPGRLATVHCDLKDLAGHGQWDLVVCNPPHLPWDPAFAVEEGISLALLGGEDGRAVYDLLLAGLDDLLAPGGHLVLAHSSLADVHRTTTELLLAGYAATTLEVCEMDIPLRSLSRYRAEVLARLYQARRTGRASFVGMRFEVHSIVADRRVRTAGR